MDREEFAAVMAEYAATGPSYAVGSSLPPIFDRLLSVVRSRDMKAFDKDVEVPHHFRTRGVTCLVAAAVCLLLPAAAGYR